ncbi:hypothetical protein [Flavobacterium algicola]|uniref:hypothetical protein n=1 Tax=Flavobacterium algicola TaxID=556529 RepID=UPI001EFE56AE|nr:hypothetical protein [Flavobacterium algicola]MCG9791167.1 hypothetical protein [Flavobacterium algicola]
MSLRKLLFTMSLITGLVSYAQSDNDLQDIKYRRSSLYTILLESDAFPKKDKVINAYNNAPFPDKYDNHNLSEKSFDPKKYTVTKEERESSGQKQSKLGGFTKGLVSEATGGIVDSTEVDMPILIGKYFEQNKTANKLVGKWFDRQVDGTFDIDLIGKRGLINASFLDMKTAEASNEGKALILTAGEELINNTFVVVSKMKFVENEPLARAIRDAAIQTAASNISVEFLRTKAINLANKGYDIAKEGYSVWTTSYLFKLKWDESISNTFYSDLWVDKTTVGSSSSDERKLNFDNSDLFQLEYIGSEKSSNLVTFSLKEKRTEDQIIDLSVTRNIDNVYAKLQKKYDVFKTKVPLFSGNPLTAKIGMKEGLEGGEKFEVLEAIMDQKTGKIDYKKKGTIKVDKKLIWDNRYVDVQVDGSEIEDKPAIDVTTFEGGDKFYSGMLIRQIN